MSFESSGFPSPVGHSGEGHDPAAPESPAPLAPMQPFGEIQPQSAAPAPFEPLRPLETAPVETFPLQQPETVQLQQPETVQFQQPDPLQPAALEPLHPTMPPPLPLLTTAEPAAEASPPPAAAPVTTPEEVANLGVPLGTLIFRAGLLTEEQLEDALQEGVRSGKRLGEVLLESGLLDERDLGRLLADQKGLRFVELSGIALDPAASALLSAEKAHMFAALPVGFEDGVPLVAVADPSNELVTENLRRALGSEPRLVVASRSDLHSTIDRVHGAVQEEPVAQAEPEALVAAPVATEPVQTAPLAPQPVETQPVAALTPLAPEPVAEPVAVAAEPAPEPETTPAPVLQPVEVEHVEPPQPETNGYTTVAPLVPETPETAPVPVAPVPVAPEPAPAPVVAEPAAVEEPVPAETFSRVEDETPVRTEQEFPSALSYDVSLRLTDGERVAIGSFGDAQKAREYARDVVKHLSDDTDGWPFFSGRFLRPDTILSVDIVPVGEPDRWLGSSVRSNWASRLNR